MALGSLFSLISRMHAPRLRERETPRHLRRGRHRSCRRRPRRLVCVGILADLQNVPDGTGERDKECRANHEVGGKVHCTPRRREESAATPTISFSPRTLAPSQRRLKERKQSHRGRNSSSEREIPNELSARFAANVGFDGAALLADHQAEPEIDGPAQHAHRADGRAQRVRATRRHKGVHEAAVGTACAVGAGRHEQRFGERTTPPGCG